jgi:hypothetical protein
VISISEILAGIDYMKLRSELAGVTGIYHAEKAFNIPPNELFWSYKRKKDWTEVETGVLSRYWYVDPNANNSYIKGPGVDYHLSVYTKNAWKYPWGGVGTRLPSLPVAGYLWLFGFEPGPGSDWGLIGFFETGNKVYAYCDGVSVDITSYLPSDYNTAFHLYAIKVNKSIAEFYIDAALIAVAIRAGINFSTVSGPPYIVFGSARKSFDESTAFIEFYLTDVSKYYIDPSNFRVMNGDPLPPRGYQLYLTGTNTKLAGYSVSSGSVTCHPIPIFGYKNKTLLFMANQTSASGGLVIEILTQTGNWRTYDTDTYTPAGSLWVYPIVADAVLVRITFTPSTYPCTINEAEAVLS